MPEPRGTAVTLPTANINFPCLIADAPNPPRDPDPGDENRHYVLRTQILYPDKSQFGEILKSKIPIEPNNRAQMIMQFVGFPVGQLGDYTVRTWIEENETRVVGPIEFDLGVEAKPAPST